MMLSLSMATDKNFNNKYDDEKSQKTLDEVKNDIDRILSKFKKIDEELEN